MTTRPKGDQGCQTLKPCVAGKSIEPVERPFSSPDEIKRLLFRERGEVVVVGSMALIKQVKDVLAHVDQIPRDVRHAARG